MNLPQVGMTQRDGMGREEGGGFRMGNTCIGGVFKILIRSKSYLCSVGSHSFLSGISPAASSLWSDSWHVLFPVV